tara:strand:- start:21497 stop:22099 length:603 start_codon:yes stop_codon:yes gene_type:complete
VHKLPKLGAARSFNMSVSYPYNPRAIMHIAPSSSKRGFSRIAVLLVLVIAIVGVAVYFSLKRDAIPDVTFIDLQGQQITTQDLQGKVVMVNFWATSCTTCVKEMPELVDTYTKYHKQGLEFIAVAMAYDPPNYVLNFVETRKLPFIVSLDTQGKLAQAFGNVQLTPTTFVINKEGEILKVYVGEPDFAALHQLLEKALAA